MNISNFFIKRPIFAAVISIVIFVIGTLAYFRLPLSEYPEVVPPTVVVRTSYPGANPTVIADTVASPLEQQVNGVEGMLYMFSQATADGVMTLTITFGLGTDLDKAQVQVQNRVSQALPRLPQEVQRLGVTTEKTSPDLLMVVHLESPDNRYDMLYLANLAILQVKDELGRLPGVGNVQVFGAGDFSMRVWLNPNKLASHSLTATDVVQAIREQNVQVAAGVLGAPPTNTGSTAFQLLVNTQGRLTTEEEFGNIIVRASGDGQITRIRDLGRVELGSSTYALRSLLDNKPAAALPISQRPGSNALQTSQLVRETMERLKKSFPVGVDYIPVRRGLQNRLRPNGFRPRIDSGCRAHICRSVDPGRDCGVGLPPDVEGIHHFSFGASRLAGRNVFDHAPTRFLSEYPVAVRARTGDRHRRGRRDRCC